MALVQLILKRQTKSTGENGSGGPLNFLQATRLVKKKTDEKAVRTRRVCICIYFLWAITITIIGGLLQEKNRVLYGLFGGVGFIFSISIVLRGINDIIMYLPRKSNIYETIAKISHYTWFEAYNGEMAARQIESFHLNFKIKKGFYTYPIAYSHQVQGNRRSSRRFTENQEIFIYYTINENKREEQVTTKFRMKFQFRDIKFIFILFLFALYLSISCLVLSCAPSSWIFLQTKNFLVSLLVYLIIVFILGIYVRQYPHFDFEIKTTRRTLDLELFNKEVTAQLIDYLPQAVVLSVILPYFDKEFCEEV